jgi:alpha-1,3-rhamnosyl/mannosyltransferase
MVDHIISDSLATAGDLERIFGKRLPQVTVVPCAVDPAFGESIEPTALEAVLHRYGLRNRGYFLHPGAIDPRKNTTTVLSAFRRYRARGGVADLAIIGLPRSTKDGLGTAEVQDGVQTLPFIPNADVVALMKGALAVVYVPSAEGFGYPLVEAMAAGTLAVISSIAVLRETSRGIALETPPREVEALSEALWIAATPSVQNRARVDRGLRRALDFSIERMTKATLDVYFEAAARRRADARTARSRQP